MMHLHQDENFHYEAIRAIALTRYFGADISEVLSILPNVRTGNFDDWYNEWHNLALRVLSTIDESKPESYSHITLRDVYFRASEYFFVSEFFLHGNRDDPRSEQAYRLWRKYFDLANEQLPIPGKRAMIPTKDGFDVPIMVFRTPEASGSNPRPTIIVGGGFDSNHEETMHVFGFSALERGFNVVLYEGPGQPALLHEQKKGWIPEWEKVVTPVVDHLIAGRESGELAFIDTDKLGLIGYSLGGYLSERAAAFEPRLAALMAIDGVWSFEDCCLKVFTDCETAWTQKDEAAFNANFDNTNAQSSTNRRWFHDHLKFSTCNDNPFEIMQLLSKMTMKAIAHQIEMPAFIGLAEEDMFFKGQPEQVAEAIGENATLFRFGRDQAAGLHCQSGALTYLNQAMYEWFAKVVDGKSK